MSVRTDDDFSAARARLVLMAVMDVREMRVRVRNGQMNMRMGMRFVAGIRKVVLVPMVFVVAVPMSVLEEVVVMLMLMALAHVQPNAKRH